MISCTIFTLNDLVQRCFLHVSRVAFHIYVYLYYKKKTIINHVNVEWSYILLQI